MQHCDLNFKIVLQFTFSVVLFAFRLSDVNLLDVMGIPIMIAELDDGYFCGSCVGDFLIILHLCKHVTK